MTEVETILSIVGVCILLTQLLLIPYLNSVRHEVKSLTTNVVEMKVKLAEMHAADALAAAVAQQALAESKKVGDNYQRLSAKMQNLMLHLASQGVYKPTAEEIQDS